MEPTPPAAPVTTNSRSLGLISIFSRASAQSMAVKPAVPRAMACSNVSASGSGTSTSERTRWRSA
jgi:hypothetical protein